MLLFFSPIEQFDIRPFFDLHFGVLDFSLTNQTFILFLLFFFISLNINSLLDSKDRTLKIIPSRWQALLEMLFKAVLSLVVTNIGKEKGQVFFPLFFSIFYFIFNANVIGLIPYSFTLTSHIIVTFTLAFFFFIGINIICIRSHGFKMFALFFPSGTSVVLGLLLVPIELISYIFKPISLSIRLFANMMAGHTLLKVIVGFSWNFVGASGLAVFVQYVPIMVIIPLFGLELGVAIIQSFVFTILCTIYLNDCVALH